MGVLRCFPVGARSPWLRSLYFALWSTAVGGGLCLLGLKVPLSRTRAQHHDHLQAACRGTDRCEMSVHAYKLIKPGVAAALSAIIYPATLLGATNEWVHNKRHI